MPTRICENLRKRTTVELDYKITSQMSTSYQEAIKGSTPNSDKMDIIEDKKKENCSTEDNSTKDHKKMNIDNLTGGNSTQTCFTNEDIDELRNQSLEMDKGKGG
ncbi:hypothetical protein RND71_008408 [Anisodus tanguticus]|uniref:Uncharacterized protein n=1 Tax=Anisodus tanguticus TaxID=243964 RepID=A0AAE1SNM4_9SOLA|nr:hypothetical protein RND71_008408 [Anisodus tanguticus]